jgi:sorbitol-specific phosphotransferase system component IIA
MQASKLSAETQELPRRRTGTGEIVPPIDLNKYSNALVLLDKPALWTNTPLPMFSHEKIESEPAPPTNLPPRETLQLLRVVRQPFKLLFKSYVGEGRSFAINVLTRAKTFFVAEVGDPIKDRFQETGYTITKFEQKKIMAEVPGLIGKREVDVSELTIQHANEEPIVLVLNRITEEKEPVATVRCPNETQTKEVRRGQSFDCTGKRYKVIDITPTQMITVDQSGEQEVTLLSS